MDHEQFDALAKSLGTIFSRRAALGTLTAGGLAALDVDRLAAKKKRKKKRKHKKRCRGFLPGYGNSCTSDGDCCTGLCCPRDGAAVCLDPKTDVCCPPEHGGSCFTTFPICCLTENAGGCCELGTHCCDSDPSGCCPD